MIEKPVTDNQLEVQPEISKTSWWWEILHQDGIELLDPKSFDRPHSIVVLHQEYTLNQAVWDEVLQRYFNQTAPETKTDITELEAQEIRAAYQFCVKTLIDEEIVPRELGLALGRVLRPSLVKRKVEGSSTFRMNRRYAIPRSNRLVKSNRYELEMSASNVQELVKHLQGFIDELDLTQLFSYQDLQMIATFTIVGHELGHAFDHLLQAKLSGNWGIFQELANTPNILKRRDLHKTLFDQTLRDTLKADVNQDDVYDLFAERAGLHTSKERIARGIDLFIFKKILEKNLSNKLDPSEVEQVAQAIVQKRREYLVTSYRQHILNVITKAKDQGISLIHLLQVIRGTSQSLLRNKTLTEAAQDSISGHEDLALEIGYYAPPLTPAQLTKYFMGNG
jgi:hypothetical protein